jgi:formamidopyrimidine-DNA glycosylase
VPELPEVESARSVVERAALNRPIVDVDDSDGYVCRPHAPGQIRAALVGHRLVAAHRRGKSMWCDAVSTRGEAADPVSLGIHLGMSGKLVVSDVDGGELDGGDYWEGRRAPGDHRWSRFSITFDDGGRLLLVDPRRLGRVVLNPDIDRLGPDAATISPARFRAAVTKGTAPIKARLLDQHAIAGIGNLLADQILWLARVNPAQPVDELTTRDVDRILRAMRRAVTAALDGGGVHTLGIIPFRTAGALCPRDRAPMARSVVGGRTSWWCSAEQRLLGQHSHRQGNGTRVRKKERPA